jgi:hypothetical protein
VEWINLAQDKDLVAGSCEHGNEFLFSINFWRGDRERLLEIFLDVCGRKLVKQMLEKYDKVVWNGLIWLRIRT